MPDPTTLAEYLLHQQHPATSTRSTPSARLAELAHDVVDDIDMLTDLDFAAWRRDRFAPEHPVEVTLNRWVRVSDDRHAMLSMRYEGGDPLLPFVEVTTLTRAVEWTRDLGALAAAADTAYGVLAPRYVRIWSSHPPGTSPPRCPTNATSLPRCLRFG